MELAVVEGLVDLVEAEVVEGPSTHFNSVGNDHSFTVSGQPTVIPLLKKLIHKKLLITICKFLEF